MKARADNSFKSASSANSRLSPSIWPYPGGKKKKKKKKKKRTKEREGKEKETSIPLGRSHYSRTNVFSEQEVASTPSVDDHDMACSYRSRIQRGLDRTAAEESSLESALRLNLDYS